MRKLLLICTLFFFAYCQPPEDKIYDELEISYTDITHQNIVRFQDKRLTDSLLEFLNHPNGAYRYAATLALASVQDKKAAQGLSNILEKEKYEQIKALSAYALGQVKDEAVEQSLVNAFQQKVDSTTSHKVNRAILEAVGKSASKKYLEYMSSVERYSFADTLLLEGQALGIYRFMLRNITHPKGTQRMVELLTNKETPSSVKLIAANYLGRAKNLDTKIFAAGLSSQIKKENDPNIRMALALALGKTKADTARSTLLSLFSIESDYRVKCNIIRALGNFKYETVSQTVFQALNDPNTHLAVSASNFFREHGQESDNKIYLQKYYEVANWRPKTQMMAAAIKHLPNTFTKTKAGRSQRLMNAFNQTQNVYEKNAILDALSEFGWNYTFLNDILINNPEPVLKSAAATGLGHIRFNKNFNQIFKNNQAVKAEMNTVFEQAIAQGDVAVLGILSKLFANPDAGFKNEYKDLTFLKDAQAGLQLPKHIETYNAMQSALDYLEGKAPSAPKVLDYNHPVNWDLVQKVKTSTSASIQTSRGEISIEFYPSMAPGSVANFIDLAQKGYFDGKVFHRVVPNFVIQGGCSRGDGWGSSDYSIRSEFAPLYYNDSGYVGMASAGKDTESTQFFITHSPTMHLDGSYTIFGKVKDGMNVVHLIEVGDKIEKITINNF